MASRRIYGAGLLLAGAAVAYASVAASEKKEDVPGVLAKASGFFPATVNGFTMTVGEFLLPASILDTRPACGMAIAYCTHPSTPIINSPFYSIPLTPPLRTPATEIGDKTFCIAAVMAMKYNRVLIFLGAAGALLVMTILSVGIGFALPNLIPKQYTHYAAAALFFYFGVKLLMESREAPAESGEHSELAEAEEELAALKLGGGNSSSSSGGGAEGGKFRGGKDEEGEEEDIENTSSTPTGGSVQRNGSGSGGGNGNGGLDMGREGAALSSSESERETDPSAKFSVTKRGGVEVGFLASLQRDWPVLTQAFMITFLAEWGDRSQIATIAMAAAQHPVGGEFFFGGCGGCGRPHYCNAPSVLSSFLQRAIFHH